MKQSNSTCTREVCALCFEVSRVGFWVSNEIWDRAAPHGHKNSILCLRCFTRIADEKNIEWDKEIKFYPVSWVIHRRTLKSLEILERRTNGS